MTTTGRGDDALTASAAGQAVRASLTGTVGLLLVLEVWPMDGAAVLYPLLVVASSGFAVLWRRHQDRGPHERLARAPSSGAGRAVLDRSPAHGR